MQGNPIRQGPVVIRLVGGLGNQMFQYAAALGLAEHQRRPLLLDVSAFATYKIRSYQLDCLNVPQDIYRGAPLVGGVSSSLATRIARRLKGGPVYRDQVYREPHFHFDPAFAKLVGGEILLDGYFQSPRYFEGVEDILRSRFKLSGSLTESAEKWAERIEATPYSVSLHVRRGDYLSKAVSGVHSALDMSYYRRAVSLINVLLEGKAEYFLFSDEPDFVAQAFSDVPGAHVVRTDPHAPWEDMFLMARCRHNIIANSSYSWWGAWLNATPDKWVVAPARWFAPDRLAACNVLDLYPDDWILLK
ncbi:alpha-1,2-fucosyltransferase [Rhizobium sp. F40D2]|uniref:alpha-1,2-fucosyltransferase n=1 Tax=Rhizobium sp. F40D2 TaxID=3453141 RepID=UPI003F1FB83F